MSAIIKTAVAALAAIVISVVLANAETNDRLYSGDGEWKHWVDELDSGVLYERITSSIYNTPKVNQPAESFLFLYASIIVECDLVSVFISLPEKSNVGVSSGNTNKLAVSFDNATATSISVIIDGGWFYFRHPLWLLENLRSSRLVRIEGITINKLPIVLEFGLDSLNSQAEGNNFLEAWQQMHCPTNNWEYDSWIDDFSGEHTEVITGEWFYRDDKMYLRIMTLAVSCHFVWISTEKPAVVRDKQTHTIRVRFDDNPVATTPVTWYDYKNKNNHTDGAYFFDREDWLLKNLLSSNLFKIEVRTIANGRLIPTFDLAGFSDAYRLLHCES